ncbi:MAG: AN1-type zinc finger protein [Methanoregula sp.]
MTRCDKCGCEVLLPFTCQHCGRKFCAGCRLPPNHDCTGIGSWNAKPRPAIGMNYSRGGGVTATGGIAPETRRRPEKKTGDGLPYLKIMIAIIVLVLLGLAWLVLSGYRG